VEDLPALIIRARNGDGDAFGKIVRRFQDMAVGYSYSLLRDFHLAEDAAQEAFLEAYLCLPQLREPAAFPGWFRRIVFKQCDRVTRVSTPSISTIDEAREVTAADQNQTDVMEQREREDSVLSAIDSLPEHERTSVMLFYMSGHSQKEISEFLDVPVTTIKKRLFSARGRLREMLVDVVTDSLRQRRPSRDEGFSESVIEMLNAARSGDVNRVQELLRRNRRLLTARDWLGNSALIMAVNSGQTAVAEMLFRAGVKPDIHEAAAIGHSSRVAECLHADANCLDSFSEQGFTPLALAAHFGHLETTRFLLDQGADASIVSRNPLQVTPLHAALFGKRVETARLLIERGSNVQIGRGGKGWPRAGWTAMHYVASMGLIELIEILLSHEADLNALDDEGLTPLDVAIAEKQDEVVEILKTSVRDNYERSILDCNH
jgi:RNA polymerase sigma factor (sigma-70 family)